MNLINVSHYSNKLLIQFLCRNSPFEYVQTDKEDKTVTLRTHPDCVDFLWIDLQKKISTPCQSVICRYPVLTNPNTGVIFAAAIGTYPTVLRLPSHELKAIDMEGGAYIQLKNLDGIYADCSEWGDDWRFCFSRITNLDEYCLKAYNYAGSL